MALRVKSGEIPEHAVIVTRSEAISYQWDQIMKWKPKLDIWPFTHGLGLLGGLASLSGMYINIKFRKTMKFKEYGTFVSLAVTSVCPGLMSSLFQMQYVAEKTFLPNDTCPLCIELRSVVIQNATAIAYPAILVPVTNFMLAIRGQTHRVPYYKNWRELLLYCSHLYKPILPSMAFIGIANTVAAIFVLHQQIKCISYMHSVLTLEQEDKEDNNF